MLTAARSGEVRGACWDEIDVKAVVWKVPGFRTKTGREHRVPLSRRALEVLEEVRAETEGRDPIFRALPTRRRPLSPGVWRVLLRRLRIDATVHGFRSSSRATRVAPAGPSRDRCVAVAGPARPAGGEITESGPV